MPKTLPGSRSLAALQWLAPAAAAAATFWLLGEGPFELPEGASAKALFAATRQVEKDWVERLLPADYVATLVVETPCRLEDPPAWAGEVFRAFRGGDEIGLAHLAEEHPGSWLPPLLWSEILIGKGEKARALEVLSRFTRGPRYKAISESSYLPVDDQRGMIHFWHRFSYLQHEMSSRDSKLFWQSLKNPIGRVKALANSGQSELPRDAPSWDEHRLRAPGCSSTRLTTFDLYNNLLVGYLEAPGFKESASRRQLEFTRRYNDRPADNPLLAALQKAKSREIERREGFVWAISNAERLLRERAANNRGLPDHPQLALNLAQLSGEACRLVPELRKPFWKLIGELLDKAAGGGERAPEFTASLIRMRLLRHIETGAGGPLPPAPEATAEVGELIARVNAATATRRDPAALTAVLAGQQAALDELGAAKAEWLTALRQDLAAAIAAQVAADAPLAEREAASRLARRALVGDSPPAALEELEDSLPFTSRLKAGLGSTFGRLSLALLVAALAFAFFWLAGHELRFRQYLFTNFYRREAEGLKRP